jgi:hypothetical protein
MNRIKDLTGMKFGRLTAIKIDHKKNNSNYWLFKCDCGSDFIKKGAIVKNGHTSSCGCLKKDLLRDKNSTHKLSYLQEYKIWLGIKKRCYDKNCKAYFNYGGRGILMSKDWINDFVKFYKDVGERPTKKHSIDRINNDLGYFKENCRWATQKQQCKNTRKVKNYFNGEKITLGEISEKTGFKINKIWKLLKNGKTVEQIIGGNL